ncbi:hypothetical protein PIB30_013230 [Stylosanthes scabra]|uniref:Uncharacterized protein n=1 Tax=Stylosanthes scabra TaxID=79078 RepID=A0ABU6R6I6_9FABA|nr:hypothetical protein [Stylosanthes scabra]
MRKKEAEKSIHQLLKVINFIYKDSGGLTSQSRDCSLAQNHLQKENCSFANEEFNYTNIYQTGLSEVNVALEFVVNTHHSSTMTNDILTSSEVVTYSFNMDDTI